ncbi:uncharacterized protein YbjT (DUF2867 family) [Actinoplanes tereljensis]|uniref:Uncharacterized protein n=1 Tax=Paractinoplanes tereljensis TaxID=571912 RepID=A0A919NWN7_9ACTN|nr:hypothetical protein [Actinoplanes tereljensis]GIF26709.1 hypothetical protein Ate02nite_94390 [Actinoplanes tereljensis]
MEHLVLLSSSTVLAPNAASNPIAAQHTTVERALDDAGLDRPGYFATNAFRWQSIRTHRVLRTAFPDAITAPVHERDIVEVAVRALLTDSQNTAYVVLGAGPVAIRDQVAATAEALGGPVRLEQVDVATYRAELTAHLPESLADRLIGADGSVPPLPAALAIDAVPELLGRRALTFPRGPATTRTISADRAPILASPVAEAVTAGGIRHDS